MRVFKQKEALISLVTELKNSGQHLGLVPTMGALHQGHLSLVKRALSENDHVVVSIFVNPTQFDNPTDLEKYPRTLDQDLQLLEDLHPEIIVFTPTAEEMYDQKIQSEVYDFDGLEHQMEGKFRPGHFDGVGTIVKKLLTTVQPHRAYFGEKDFQQLQIIKKLNEKHQLGVEIIPCPISREENGLARSSRNERLSPDLREKAAFIYQTISKAKEFWGTKSPLEIIDWITDAFKNNPDFELEYAEIAEESSLVPARVVEQGKHYRLFIAVYANQVRLIDTLSLN